MNKKMDKKYLILIIPLTVLAVIGMLSGNVYSLGHYKDQGGPGGTVADCNVCHDFAGGYYNNYTLGNLRWVKSTIYDQLSNPHTVKFVKFSSGDLPTGDGTLADGNDSKLDGPCEVCHTVTKYHKNTGDGKNHFDGVDCTLCHPHFLSDINNYFEPRFVGNQSHFTHFDDPKGPQFQIQRPNDYCTYFCHSTTDFSKFKDALPLATTTVCNPCHSKGGTNGFDGVDDPVIGAKPNWEPAAYKAPTNPGDWPSKLQDGKENWCAGCHDNGTSVINGVSAPNVMGDNVFFGYNVSGHGRNPSGYVKCEACHDLTMLHTDGNPRTYSAQANNYKTGYRLAKGLTIPKKNIIGSPSHYELCLDCHIYSDIMGPSSNFWNQDNSLATRNLHNVHVGNYSISAIECWDSDWSCIKTSPSDQCSTADDSALSCTACHNVHGSRMVIAGTNYPSKPMIRHGELISSPGTSNKVPALDFRWYDVYGVRTADFNQSVRGGLLCGMPENVAYNYVCWGCHTQGEVTYTRNLGVTVESVWTSNTDPESTPKDVFHPGDPIRYNVRFTVTGLNPSYYITENGVAQKVDGTGQKQTFTQSQTLAPGSTYVWAVDRLIPSTIVPPPGGISAMVSITMGMYNAPGGLLIDQDLMSALFRIE